MKLISQLNSPNLRNSLIYVGSQVLNSSLSFFLIPFISHRITPEEYGILATFNVLLGLFKTLLLFGTSTLLTKNYFSQSEKEFSHYLGNCIGIILFIFLLTFGFAFISLEVIDVEIKIDDKILYLVLISSLIDVIYSIFLTVLQIWKQATHYAIVSFGLILSNLTLSIFLIETIMPSHFGRIYGIIIPLLVAATYSLIVLLRKYPFQNSILNFKKFPAIMYLGFPLVITQIGGWALDSLDRLLLNHFLGFEETGIYSIGYTVGSIVMFVQVGVSRAWAPFFYENLNHNRTKSIRKWSFLYLIALLLISLILYFSYPIFYQLFIDQEYYGGVIISRIVAISYFVNSIFKISSLYFVNYSKTKYLAVIVVVEALVNLIFNLILIPQYGMIGAAVSTLIAFGVGAILTLLLLNRVIRLKQFIFASSINSR